MPKKGKVKPEPVAATQLRSVEIELLPGEEDRANVAYIEKLGSAWACIQEHDLFRDIQGAKPAGITANANESGTQSPFDLKSYRAALKTAGQSYTAGINLFWIDLMWSATPGVPLRVSAIELMAKTIFGRPTPLGTIHVAVPDHEYNPLERKGALLRVSPEEVTGAIVLAIARDIRNSESDEVLQAWKQIALSTTCVFKVMPSASDRYWYALNQREHVSMTYTAVHRSTLQRVHEISRLMKKMRETLPPGEVTASAIAKTYQDKLQMLPGGSGTVTFNFVDCCATITNKLLDVPSIAWCLQDLDERSALSEDANPFDSHSRLQAIIDKCKANNQAQLIWVVQGIWYSWRRGNGGKSLSVADIKGSAQSGNRGVADVLIYKLNLKNALLARARVILNPESADWLTVVASVAESFKSWFENEESVDKSWRAGRPPSETKFLNLFSEVVFGRTYDHAIKFALRSGKSPDDAMLAQGLAEDLREIEDKRQQEQKLAQPAEAAGQGTSSAQDQGQEDPDMDDIAFRLPPTGDSNEPTVVKASQVQDGARRETIRSIMSATRQHIAAQIHLIPQDPEAHPHPHGGLSAALMATAGGKLRGEPQPDNPTKSKYIGVFYDFKVAGEANHRPMLRVPPLRAEQLRRLVDIARSRFGDEVANDELPKGDLYFMFDGGGGAARQHQRALEAVPEHDQDREDFPSLEG